MKSGACCSGDRRDGTRQRCSSCWLLLGIINGGLQRLQPAGTAAVLPRLLATLGGCSLLAGQPWAGDAGAFLRRLHRVLRVQTGGVGVASHTPFGKVTAADRFLDSVLVSDVCNGSMTMLYTVKL